MEKCCEFIVPRSMTTSSEALGARPETRRSDESARSGFQLTPSVGGPLLVSAFPLGLIRVTTLEIVGCASFTPGTARTVETSDVGTGTRFCPKSRPPPLVPYGALPCTTTSTVELICWKRLLKLCFTVSVSTKVPAMNDTPRTMAVAVRASRTLCATRLRKVALNIGSVSQPLHVVDDLLGHRLHQVVHNTAVGQEDDAIGIRGCDGVVGHHHDGLSPVTH